MFTLILLFAMQVATPKEMACIGSVREETISADVFISGMKEEGKTTLASDGQVVFLSGPDVASLKVGAVQRVIRPEGKVLDPSTRAPLGMYFKDIGTIKIETVEKEYATAHVLSVCQPMIKGDLVIPSVRKSAVAFNGALSNELTAITPEHVSSILLGKDDSQILATGQICFIGIGGREGVQVGDRFTIFRSYPLYNPRDADAAGSREFLSYSKDGVNSYQKEIAPMLQTRTLPARILGDLVVVEVGQGISTAKIINSNTEITPGDKIVKR
jgi:hypothetical protein